jgi:Uri superfamily endonuclease
MHFIRSKICLEGFKSTAPTNLMPGQSVKGVKGSYVLLVELSRPAEIAVGRLGRVRFEKGFYAYVGSAMGGLEKRIRRHLSKEKKIHWHIDYLLDSAASRVVEVFRFESAKRLECHIAGKLSEKLECVPGFGCSDCGCGSHLFTGSVKDISESVLEACPQGPAFHRNPQDC